MNSFRSASNALCHLHLSGLFGNMYHRVAESARDSSSAFVRDTGEPLTEHAQYAWLRLRWETEGMTDRPRNCWI